MSEEKQGKFTDASEQLRAAFPDAIAALREIAADKAAPAAARATAARSLLEYGVKLDNSAKAETLNILDF
mgnify:CR=1 FL=1